MTSLSTVQRSVTELKLDLHLCSSHRNSPQCVTHSLLLICRLFPVKPLCVLLFPNRNALPLSPQKLRPDSNISFHISAFSLILKIYPDILLWAKLPLSQTEFHCISLHRSITPPCLGLGGMLTAEPISVARNRTHQLAWAWFIEGRIQKWVGYKRRRRHGCCEDPSGSLGAWGWCNSTLGSNLAGN